MVYFLDFTQISKYYFIVLARNFFLGGNSLNLRKKLTNIYYCGLIRL